MGALARHRVWRRSTLPGLIFRRSLPKNRDARGSGPGDKVLRFRDCAVGVTMALHGQVLRVNFQQFPFLLVFICPRQSEDRESVCSFCGCQGFTGFWLCDAIGPVREPGALPGRAVAGFFGERYLQHLRLGLAGLYLGGEGFGGEMVLQVECVLARGMKFPGHAFPRLRGIKHERSAVGAVRVARPQQFPEFLIPDLEGRRRGRLRR